MPEKSNFRKLLEEASSALSIYRSPDIAEAKELIDKILVAGDMGSTIYETIVAIDDYGDYFEIRTEWSARCCAQTSEYRIPSSVVDADDPLKAMRLLRNTQAISQAEAHLASCLVAVERAQQRLADVIREAKEQ